MKIDVYNGYNFIDYMRKFDCSKKFTNEGLHAMYDYFEELYDVDEDYTINAIELCLYYYEYDSIKEYIEECYTVEESNAIYYYTYDNDEVVYTRTDAEVIDELRDETVIIEIPYSRRVIVFQG
jgi:hypothetical protein